MKYTPEQQLEIVNAIFDRYGWGAAFDEDGNVYIEYAVRHTFNPGEEWEYDLGRILREGRGFQGAFNQANKMIQIAHQRGVDKGLTI